MFNEIIGNEKNKTILTNIIEENIYSHSYMFIGINGIGKFLFAKEVAKKALQSDKENNPNLFIINSENEIIKNEVIKNLNKTIYEKPLDSNKKVYIINNADKMTEEAQNSLLKTLEEPPEYIIIILIVQNEAKLLNTIKSRCTKILFNKLSEFELKKIFEKSDIKVSENILKLANGSAENVINLKDNEDIFILTEKAFNSIGNNPFDFIKLKDNLITKENIKVVLEFFSVIFYNKVLQEEETSKYLQCIDIIEKTKNRLDKNCNFDMTVDNFLFSVWEAFNV